MDSCRCVACGARAFGCGDGEDDAGYYQSFYCGSCGKSFDVYDMTEKGTVDHELMREAMEAEIIPIVFDDDDPWTWYQWLKEGNGDPYDFW